MLEQIQSFALTLGLNTPLKRFAVLSVLSGGALVITKPRVFFDEEGIQRPFSLMKEDEKSGVEGTPIPWWLAAGLSGFVLANVI